MKKNLLLIAVAMVFATTQLSAQLTLIHYWNFNSWTPVSGEASSSRDVVLSPLTPISAATVSPLTTGTLVYQAIPGTASPYKTYWDSNSNGTPGTTANQRNSVQVEIV
jgi:hypothetical protein